MILRSDAVNRVLRDGVDGFATGHAHFDRAEFVKVTRDGCLRGFEAFILQQPHELTLVGDRVLPKQNCYAVLPSRLAHRFTLLIGSPRSSVRLPQEPNE